MGTFCILLRHQLGRPDLIWKPPIVHWIELALLSKTTPELMNFRGPNREKRHPLLVRSTKIDVESNKNEALTNKIHNYYH